MKKYRKSLFEIDYIVKEELWRSISIFFFAFIGVAMLIESGYIKTDLNATFYLAPIITFIHFVIKVWYRKNLQSPIILHFENSRPIRELIILIAIYAAYLYFSLQYPILQKGWILILLLVALKLTKVFELNRPTSIKLILFFLTSSAFILIQYYFLQLPLMPLLKGILALGASMLVFVVLAKRSGLDEPDYLYRMDMKDFFILMSILAFSAIVAGTILIWLDRVLN